MSARETRSRTRIRIDAIQRLAMWHCLSGITPHYLVTEYPKSGGTWLAQMIAAYFEVPFPRNSRPPMLKRQTCVLHGHHLYSRRFKNVVCLLRDGRDVMTSAYYYMLVQNRSLSDADRVQRRLPCDDPHDVRANMPAFIEYMFTRPSLGGSRFTRGGVTWRDFVRSWIDKDTNLVTYENMLSDAPAAMAPVIGKLTQSQPDMDRLRAIAQRFSFKNQTQRNPGEENHGSFLRKGIAGDWKNKFTQEACDVFKHHAGDALILAGYEKNTSWSNSFAH